ncbi:MAG: serine/threonine-protein kinase [Acidobacteria bacterium]|nr:serine/threonine-protein kinase [Acidobacteriota bacterium]
MPEREDLISVARAIAAGLPVDWATVESSAGDESLREVIRELRVIAEIAELHHSLPGALPPSSLPAPPSGTPVLTSQADIAAGVLESPLALGSWGPFTLLERVGRGSFGEVYRAWDRRLDREVALKLLRRHDLPDDAVGSTAIEEGRLLARVRHPNVVTVHGADRIEGGVGLWMEFVHGRTLERALQERGPFSADETVAVGVEICRALAAVHQAGLLHRDIKAQNVMRQDDGRLVLMDFGAGREQPGEESGTSTDMAGTPLYLAPEIFDGQPATVQSDLYSVGVLLYHLLTGRYPVTGRTLREVRDCHRHGARVSLGDARPNLPDVLVRAIDRALHVEASARYGSAGDMAMALAIVDARAPAARPWRLLATAATLLAVAIASWTLVSPTLQQSGGSLRGTAPRPGAFSDQSAINIRRLDLPRLLFAGQLSQDGRYLPYSAESYDRLLLLDLATGKTRTLASDAGQRAQGIIAEAVVSPDSSEVAYSWQSDACRCVELRIVDARGAGNPPRLLVRDESLLAMTLADWSWDRTEILALLSKKNQTHEIALVSAQNGSVRILKAGLESLTALHLSPDGLHVAYDYPVAEDNDARDVFLLSIDRSRDVPLVRGRFQDAYPVWTPDGRGVLFVSDRSGTTGLWLVPVLAGEPHGEPQLVTKDAGALAPRSLAGDATLFYSLQSGIADVYTARFGPDGSILTDSVTQAAGGFLGSNSDPEWSPDGRSLAYVSQRRSTGPRARAIVIHSLDTGEERELWPDAPGIVQPRWSPDGRSFLVWYADRLGAGGAWLVDARTGSTLDSYGSIRHLQWAPDGGAFYFFSLRDFTRVLGTEIASGRTQEVYRVPAGHSIRAFYAVSPDGRSLALTINEPNGSRLEVVPTSGGPAHEVMRFTLPDLFSIQQWTPDGANILFTRFRTDAMLGRGVRGPIELWSVPATGGAPRSLNLKGDQLAAVRVSPDGARIAFRTGQPSGDFWLMRNFLPRTVAGRR